MTTFPLKTAVLLAALPLASCMTTYDANGRQVQTVDPGAAAVGVLAAGVVGYAIGQNNGPRYYHGGYHRGGYYRGGHHGHYRCY